MTYTDYYQELYTVIDAALEGKIKLWESNIYPDNYDSTFSEYYTEEELLLAILSDNTDITHYPECTLKQIHDSDWISKIDRWTYVYIDEKFNKYFTKKGK